MAEFMNRKTSDERTSYELLQRPSARRQLNRLRIEPIVEAIRNLADEPRPPRAEKLVGRAEWRIRVGDYRILYLIDDRNKTITITAVAHRRDVYR